MLENVRKSKILLSLVAIILLVVLLGNVKALATDEGSTNTSVNIIQSNTSVSTNTSTDSTNSSNPSNTSANTSNTINSITTTSNNTSNNSTNNTTNNTSTYNNTSNTSSSLPYTGTSSKTVLLIVVFAISAVYAYKKVNDYNL